MKDNTRFVIINARIFDGEKMIDSPPVIIEGRKITKIGGEVPTGLTVIYEKNCMLLPGLIDAHTHSSVDALRAALSFGVTTEF